MNRIISFDICSIIVTSTVLFSVLFRKLIKGRTNLLFLLLLIDTLLTGLIDVYDSLFGNVFSANPYNVPIQMFFNNMYFVFRLLVLPLYILFLMSSMSIWYKLKRNIFAKISFFIPYFCMIVCLIINCFTGAIFYFNKGSIYVRGRKFYIIYIVSAIYFISLMYLLIRYRYMISKHKYIVFMSFVPFNIIAVVIQFVNIDLRLEIFAMSMTMLMFAIAVQKAEELVDPVVNTQSYNAFIQDMDKAYRVNREMYVMFIKITNHRALRNNLGLETFCKILRQIGGKLQQMSRILSVYTDVYYLDGGEFAIVADHFDYEKFLDLGRLIVAYMQESCRLNKMEIILESKVCIAECPNELQSYSMLLNFSNTFHNTVPDETRVIQLKDILESKDFRMKNKINEIIKESIENHKFEMYYQPIYSVEKDKFVSAEALIRLHTEEFGYISPAIFIPAAETSGAIHDIGDFVLEDVCRFISSGQFKNSGLEYVEINLSVSQCIEPRLIDKIKGLTEKYHISPAQINLEITETAVDYDPQITDHNIWGLYHMGYKFSLDDYGTGYSNIKRVVSLPLSIVKLDKSFVDAMNDPKMWNVIVNTVGMLKKMKKKILVEGVEDGFTFMKFAELGCDYIQGFLFSKPMPEKEFVEFVIISNAERITGR